MKVEELRGDGDRVRALASAIATVSDGWDPAQRVPALYRAAELAAPEDEAQAESYWSKVLALNPSETRALDLLRGALKERGDDSGEARLLHDRLAHVEGAEELHLLRDLADLADTDEDLEAAHLAVLKTDPSVRSSRVALADLFERTERYEDAADVLAAEAGSTPTERKEFFSRIAEIAREKLSDVPRTIFALESMMDADVTDESSLVELV
jgi:thioredoxin-like negative regulator of GroEL